MSVNSRPIWDTPVYDPEYAAIVVIDLIRHSETLWNRSDELQQRLMIQLLDMLASPEVQRHYNAFEPHFTGDGFLLFFKETYNAVGFCRSLQDIWRKHIISLGVTSQLPPNMSLPFRSAIHFGKIYPLRATRENRLHTSKAIDHAFDLLYAVDTEEIIASEAVKDELYGSYSWTEGPAYCLKGDPLKRAKRSWIVKGLKYDTAENIDELRVSSDTEERHFVGFLYYLLATSYFWTEKAFGKEQLELFAKAIENGFEHPSLYNNMGLALQESSQLPLALEAYEKAIALDSSYPLAYNNRGTILAVMGRIDVAKRDFSKAIELLPSFALAYYNMANLLMDVGKINEAIAYFNQAIDVNPFYSQAYNNLGNAYHSRGKYDRAIEAFDNAIRHNSMDPYPYNNKGLVLSRKGKHQEARQLYIKALELWPEYAAAHYNIARNYCVGGDIKAALDELKKAVDTEEGFVIQARVEKDFKRIRHLPEFKALVGEKEKS
jgi:tetratricopeptide (TPR) repeat protein